MRAPRRSSSTTAPTPNIVAGNGMTPLDVADANGASDVVAMPLLRSATVAQERGGTRDRGPDTNEPEHELDAFEQLASDILVAYQSGEPNALQRVRDFFKRSFSWSEMRAGAARNAWAKPRATMLSLDDTRGLIAHQRGFASWVEFARSVTGGGGRARNWNLPLYRIEGPHRHAACPAFARGPGVGRDSVGDGGARRSPASTLVAS